MIMYVYSIHKIRVASMQNSSPRCRRRQGRNGGSLQLIHVLIINRASAAVEVRAVIINLDGNERNSRLSIAVDSHT